MPPLWLWRLLHQRHMLWGRHPVGRHVSLYRVDHISHARQVSHARQIPYLKALTARRRFISHPSTMVPTYGAGRARRAEFLRRFPDCKFLSLTEFTEAQSFWAEFLRGKFCSYCRPATAGGVYKANAQISMVMIIFLYNTCLLWCPRRRRGWAFCLIYFSRRVHRASEFVNPCSTVIG